MSRKNYYLLVGVVLLLALAALGGQLEFRRTHPGRMASLAPAPGPAGDGRGEPAGGGPATGGGASEPGAPLDIAALDQGPGPNDGRPFPAEINGLPRTAYVTGEAARAEISKLHGKEIPASSAEVATYGGGQEKVVVWVTASPTKEEAQALFRRMWERMEANPATYTRPELLNIKNKAYFSTRGNGAENYFYLRGTRIYWVALEVPPDKIMGVLSFVVNQL
jgi:hypothetical protein